MFPFSSGANWWHITASLQIVVIRKNWRNEWPMHKGSMWHRAFCLRPSTVQVAQMDTVNALPQSWFIQRRALLQQLARRVLAQQPHLQILYTLLPHHSHCLNRLLGFQGVSPAAVIPQVHPATHHPLGQQPLACFHATSELLLSMKKMVLVSENSSLDTPNRISNKFSFHVSEKHSVLKEGPRACSSNLPDRMRDEGKCETCKKTSQWIHLQRYTQAITTTVFTKSGLSPFTKCVLAISWEGRWNWTREENGTIHRWQVVQSFEIWCNLIKQVGAVHNLSAFHRIVIFASCLPANFEENIHKTHDLTSCQKWKQASKYRAQPTVAISRPFSFTPKINVFL